MPLIVLATLLAPPSTTVPAADEAASPAEVDEAIGRAEAGLGRVADEAFMLDAQEALAEARAARERGDLESAFEQADKINLELEKIRDEQSDDN
jgi:hypothetical protein